MTTPKADCTGPALLVLSGPSGTGTATIMRRLADKYERRGHTTGIVDAADPTSPPESDVVIVGGTGARRLASQWQRDKFAPGAALTVDFPSSEPFIADSWSAFCWINEFDRRLCDISPQLLPPLHVFYGPSGVGKGTVLNRVKEHMPQLRVGRSATTRMRRPGEGDDWYDFLTVEQFQHHLAAGDFMEHAAFGGNYYGTWLRQTNPAWLILEIELQGALQVHARVPAAKLVRIEPPGDSYAAKLAELNRRIDSDTVTRNDLALRRQRVKEELSGYADSVVVNDDIERAAREIAWMI